MGLEEIKQSLTTLQKDYNRLCGEQGHIQAQIWDLERKFQENKGDMLTLMKKANTLSAQLPKEEPKSEEKQDGQNPSSGTPTDGTAAA